MLPQQVGLSTVCIALDGKMVAQGLASHKRGHFEEISMYSTALSGRVSMRQSYWRWESSTGMCVCVERPLSPRS
eukprot:4004520-Amphidinium_carterae.1